MRRFQLIFHPIQALALTILIAAVFNLALSAPVLAANGSVSYTYDALGRITQASYDTGIVINYAYDANGNRLSQFINVNAAPLIWGGAPVTPCVSNCWDQAVWN